MSEEKSITPLPPKGIGSIKWYDLLKGMYYTAIGAVLALISYVVTGILTETPHLPSWVEILPYVKTIVFTIGGYLVGQLGVNNVGQILTKDKETVKIDVDTLQDLKQAATDSK